nr:ribonuclease H-like domain-containing protein [Tanacetum cinerariifolium]
YQEFKGDSVAFGGSNGKIIGKGKIKAGRKESNTRPLVRPRQVYNLETKRVEENLHVNFLENKPNVAGKGHPWMFDLDYLTNSMIYEPILLENQANNSVGPQEANNSACTYANDDQGANSEENDLHDEHFVLPIWSAYSTTGQELKGQDSKDH